MQAIVIEDIVIEQSQRCFTVQERYQTLLLNENYKLRPSRRFFMEKGLALKGD